MFLRLLFLLTVVPIVELFVLLSVHGALAEQFGFGQALLITVGSIVLTGALGASLARSQGLGVLRALQQSMAEGQFPGQTIMDGAMVLFGGALLLTPGFLTDALGLSLLIPTTRKLYRKGLAAWLRYQMRHGRVTVFTNSSPFKHPPSQANGSPPSAWDSEGPMIDVTPEAEAETETEADPRHKPESDPETDDHR